MKRIIALALAATVITVATGCENYRNVPPNAIGMMLTPTGYDGEIYTPGQVDISRQDADGRGNQLVLIQRSGIEIKESFIGPEVSEDKEDHRCLTADKAPVTLDHRMLLALPDYEPPQGKRDMARIFVLGNPRSGDESRTLWISAQSIYEEQARQAARIKIRQIAASYENFDAIFAAFSDTTENGLSRRINTAVVGTMAEQNIPLRLVSGATSNLKPDPSVTAAIAAEQAANGRVKALQVLTDWIGADLSGSRRMVYQMQAWQEIVSTGNTNGHNTILYATGNNGGVLPLPQRR